MYHECYIKVGMKQGTEGRSGHTEITERNRYRVNRKQDELNEGKGERGGEQGRVGVTR
jgi:hypothetical protein